MRIFLDTSVLISAVVQQHGNHAKCYSILEQVQNGRDEGIISGHGLAEIYAVLTKAPRPFRHSPEQALLSIEENVLKYFKIFALSGAEYAALIRDAGLKGIQGGTIYDFVLLKCAQKSDADTIYTLNLRHFQSVAPKEIVSRLQCP